MLYNMVTFTIIIPPMLAYIPYMDPMGKGNHSLIWNEKCGEGKKNQDTFGMAVDTQAF